jgi:hypothetical protein
MLLEGVTVGELGTRQLPPAFNWCCCLSHHCSLAAQQLLELALVGLKQQRLLQQAEVLCLQEVLHRRGGGRRGQGGGASGRHGAGGHGWVLLGVLLGVCCTAAAGWCAHVRDTLGRFALWVCGAGDCCVVQELLN